MIKELQDKLHKESADAGWWKDHEAIDAEYGAYRIAMLHGVLSDALETIRKGGDIQGDELIVLLKSKLFSMGDLSNIPEEKIILSTKLALLHSEVSEAFDGLVTGNMDKHLPHRTEVEVELADAFIRLLDFSGRLGLDLESAIREKQEYNKTRADHQPENRAKSNGKLF